MNDPDREASPLPFFFFSFFSFFVFLGLLFVDFRRPDAHPNRDPAEAVRLARLSGPLHSPMLLSASDAAGTRPGFLLSPAALLLSLAALCIAVSTDTIGVNTGTYRNRCGASSDSFHRGQFPVTACHRVSLCRGAGDINGSVYIMDARRTRPGSAADASADSARDSLEDGAALRWAGSGCTRLASWEVAVENSGSNGSAARRLCRSSLACG